MAEPADALPGPVTLEGVEMVARSCPVCGSDGEDRVFAPASFAPKALDGFAFASRKLPEYMHYRILACRRCDALYCSPVPTREYLETAYRQAAFDASEESRFAASTYARFLPGLGRRLPDRDGALDVGTGDGAFLEQLLAHGFVNVLGIEPSAAPVAQAAPAVKPLIRQCAFRASGLEKARFSLVTCFQTLEHILDPMGFCREAHDLLKDHGAVVLACHNHRALSARLMGLRSPIFDIEHLQLFSPRSIRRVLEGAGFTGIEVHRIANRYPLRYWARMAPLPSAIKAPVLRTLKNGSLGGIALYMPAGNMVAIGYKST